MPVPPSILIAGFTHLFFPVAIDFLTLTLAKFGSQGDANGNKAHEVPKPPGQTAALAGRGLKFMNLFTSASNIMLLDLSSLLLLWSWSIIFRMSSECR